MSDCAAVVVTSAEPLRGPFREPEEKALVQSEAKESSLGGGLVLHVSAPYIMHGFCSRPIHDYGTQHFF